ncbi:hypothetical protein [Terriglobus sp.]|uniref:hypothetical protein n=1 Tax=Terriglobus sp. TaxID=1889013 RepID=UPI003B004FC8
MREVLTSTDRVHGFQDLAGSGKTGTLAATREGAEQGGYRSRASPPLPRRQASSAKPGPRPTRPDRIAPGQRCTKPGMWCSMTGVARQRGSSVEPLVWCGPATRHSTAPPSRCRMVRPACFG